MGGNFKFQVQDSFLEYFFLEIWRSKQRIALSEKKAPLVIGGDNLPSPVRIGLTDLQNIGGGGSGPPAPPSSGTTDCDLLISKLKKE